jgi:two-component system OmpR family response regulator
MSCVLLVAHDPSTATLAEHALSAGGHEVITVRSSDAAIRSLFNVRIDAAVVDSAIGEEEVKEFCGWLRSSSDNCPIVLLTPAGARWLTDLLPVDPGLDEIVAKPCEGKEIRRAVEKTLDAAAGARPEVISIGNLALNRNSHELRGDGVAVQLTPTEFRLMYYLIQRRGSIVSAEELLEKVWEFFPGTGSSELVRSHVRNLRNKLRTVTGGADLVQTVPRRGYRLL